MAMETGSRTVNNGKGLNFQILATCKFPSLFPEGAALFGKRNSAQQIDNGRTAYNAGDHTSYQPSVEAYTIAGLNLLLKTEGKYVNTYSDVLELYNDWGMLGFVMSTEKRTELQYQLAYYFHEEAGRVIDYWGSPSPGEEVGFRFKLHPVQGVGARRLYAQLEPIKTIQHTDYPLANRVLLDEKTVGAETYADYKDALAGLYSPVYRAGVPNTMTDRTNTSITKPYSALFMSSGNVQKDMENLKSCPFIKMFLVRGKLNLNQ